MRHARGSRTRQQRELMGPSARFAVTTHILTVSSLTGCLRACVRQVFPNDVWGPPHLRKPPDRRKLIAVVYADMVGYSRLIGLDDAGTLERLRTLRRDADRPSDRGAWWQDRPDWRRLPADRVRQHRRGSALCREGAAAGARSMTVTSRPIEPSAFASGSTLATRLQTALTCMATQ